MSFYLKPPKGVANIKEFEESCRQRLKCYEHLFSKNIADVILELEYLIEDSNYDRLGHYLFRYAALKSHIFLASLIVNEVKLLDVRLNCYSQTDVKLFVKKLKKHSTDCLNTSSVEGPTKKLFTLFVQVFTLMLQKGYIEHGFQEHTENCQECFQFQINIPFYHCPDLLATREYEISKGYLHLYPYQWKHLILSLYKTYLQQCLQEMKYIKEVHNALEDERIKHIIILIHSLFSKSTVNRLGGNQEKFQLETFDQEAQKFPLCMQNLYGILQKNNRLGHHARFGFSLYMKSIRLSLEDALTFWKNTYSKEHASCARCTHSWQDSEKRYIYGIRHLYGLEGSRQSYGVKSCQEIQEKTLAANEEGGCPFRHFDDVNLRKILKDCLPPNRHDQVEVIIYKRQEEHAMKACELFFAEQLNVIFGKEGVDDDEITFRNPAQYYFLMKNLAS